MMNGFIEEASKKTAGATNRNTHKRCLKRVCGISLMIAITTYLYVYITDIMIFTDRVYYSEQRGLDEFYTFTEDSIDVIALGPSTTYRGFSSPELFVAKGITAYNFGTSGQPLFTSYYLLEEALKTQSPKLVVVDTEGLTSATQNEGSYRRILDNLPFSMNRLEALCNRSRMDGADSLLSYLLPMQKYHSVWKMLTRFSFRDVKAIELSMIIQGFLLDNRKGLDRETVLLTDIGEERAEYKQSEYEYLLKIIDTCKSNNISIILVTYPMTLPNTYSTSQWTDARHNTTQDIAKEQEVVYIDLSVKDVFDSVGLVLPDDMLDAVHVNTFGAAKITRYLSEIMISMADIQDHRNDSRFLAFRKYAASYSRWIVAQQ
jgi:hypothetical protein